MNWRSNTGKSALIKMLMKEHGFSKRKSEKAVKAVFDCMARALRRGEEVELPIGWIRTASPPAKRKKQKWQRFKNIQTRAIFRRIVRLPDKIIRFRANPKLIVKGPGLLPQHMYRRSPVEYAFREGSTLFVAGSMMITICCLLER